MTPALTPGSRWPLWGVLAVGLLVLAAGLYRWNQDRGASIDPAGSAPRSAASAAKEPARPGPPPGSSGAAVSPAPPDPAREKAREPLYDHWRSAILNKNAPQVLAAERAFLGDRARFHDGLAALAEKDPEERVRSFSTRVLGNIAMAGDVDFFTRLLENDASPYVRQNAAWALGQLGQGAAAQALARVSEGDPEPEVRAAATNALSRIR